MEQEELLKITDNHRKWVIGHGGERADLSFADLSSADLSYADLSFADLSFADLSFADLRSANLHSADLRSADLSSADLTKTILESINWLAYIGIVPDSKGYAYAYKMSRADGRSCQFPTDKINYATQKTFKAELDRDVYIPCSNGINIATFQWCLNNRGTEEARLFLMKFKVDADNICAPVGTDGKFRVGECAKIGECDWKGNLLKR